VAGVILTRHAIERMERYCIGKPHILSVLISGCWSKTMSPTGIKRKLYCLNDLVVVTEDNAARNDDVVITVYFKSEAEPQRKRTKERR
jgi:hypothetical protein